MRAIWIVPIIASILILGTFSAAYAVGVWEAKTSIPPARHLAMSANHDGLFYLMGGNDGVSTALSNFNVYDPATDTWTPLAPLPEIRYATTAENIGDKIYLVGGWNVPLSFVPHTTLYEYDIPLDTWTIKLPLPSRSGCSSSGSIDGILYVLNACDGFGLHKKFFDKYDPAANGGLGAWTTLPEPPNYHANGNVGEVIDGKLYVAGGCAPAALCGVAALSTVESYDPTTDTWTTEPSLLTPRSSHVGEGIDGKLYVAVGIGSFLDTLHVYDPSPTPEEQAELLIDELGDIILANTGTPLADAMQDTIDQAQDVLNELNETPPDNGDAVGSIGDVVSELQAAVDDELLGSTLGAELMDQFTGIARQLAVNAIDEVIAQGGDADVISEAQGLLAEGDALRTSEAFEDAVDSYEDAVSEAEDALP